MERSGKFERGSGLLTALVTLAPVLLAGCAMNPLPPVGDPPPSGGRTTITVRDGDTVSQIAQDYGVDVADIVDMNDLYNADRIYAGETLVIPGRHQAVRETHVARTTYRPAYTHANYTPRYEPTPRPVSYTVETKPLSSPNAQDDRATLLARAQGVIDRLSGSSTAYSTRAPQNTVEDLDHSRFVWPVRGQVIAAFGLSSTGERNDGINIATAMGEPIHAAAAGTVTYAGNELKGYGNLVLIKHDDGYVTAYAHAERILVNRGDHVARGQVIAYAGESGDVQQPQLHFEIRHGVKPVDPAALLVARNS